MTPCGRLPGAEAGTSLIFEELCRMPTPTNPWKTRLAIFVLCLMGGLIAYTWLTLNWSYAKGERAGYIQKISQKGWICKTWEGELAMVSMPGTLSEKFLFTVRDENVIKLINENMGHRIVLTYEQHLGVPSTCFGETGYFVKDVERVLDDSPTPP